MNPGKVWSVLMHSSDLPNIPPSRDDIIVWIVPISKFKTVSSVVGRLVLAASSYYVWQERNNRLFSKGERRVEELRDIITDVVRLKLASLRFKSTARVERLRTFWKLLVL
ncbi:hypothetical protein Tco_0697403 [Tanacetum coccineum]